jgi:hypothetical protein
MFSDKLEDKELKVDEELDKENGEENKVIITVDRAVAKVAAFDVREEKVTHSDGTFGAVKFAIRNRNNGFYPLQLKENGVVKDHNRGIPYDPTEFSHGEDYVSVNANESVDAPDWTAKYTTENTSEEPVEGNSTYAVIQVIFQPKFYDEDGELMGSDENATTFWTVKAADGKYYYFKDSETATEYATARSLGTPVEYEDGKCYYSAYLDAGSGGYSTLRNKLYKLRIKNIVPPGRPSPEPGNPDTPLGQPVDLDFEIILNDWIILVDDYELH